MRIVKYGSSGCGPCTKMSHYDEKVVRELGLDFEYVKKKTPDYNSPVNEEIKSQLKSIASPTYVLVEDTTVLGHFVGGMDKGKFRTKVQELIDGQFKPTFDFNNTPNHNLRENNLGGDSDSHCVEFNGNCSPFRWDCKPDSVTICRPDKKEKYVYKVTTHGCNGRCGDEGGGDDLHYKWEDADGKEVGSDDKEIEFEVGPDTPLGRLNFTAYAFCRNHPDNKELSKTFRLTIEDCTAPPPPEIPDTIEPPAYDCECPPNTVQLWYDEERGVYGSNYDKDQISSIQYINAWKDKARQLKLWLRPGGCNLDDVCQCVTLCSTTTAGGYEITEADIECETNEKENSVLLKFKGSYMVPTGSGETEPGDKGDPEPEPEGPEPEPTPEPEPEPDSFGISRCSPKIQDIEISDGKICPKGNGEVVSFTVSTSCCEPNNGRFRIDAGDGKKDLKGMDGVSFPGKGDNNNDHGSGDELKDLRIHCDEFEYDIKDHDWKIYWDGDCDQAEGSFDIDHTFKASSSCDDEPEEPDCESDDDCPPGKVCKDGKCVDPDCKDEDCPPGQICIDGECRNGCNVDEDCHPEEICVDGECVPAMTEVSGQFYPQCLVFQCCPDCDDEIPPFEPGDNDDCDNKPEPSPVPGTDGPAATVYLYDRLNHTYVFCCPILADVTWLLPFDAIPPIFQRYITAAATVRAAAQLVNNPQLFQLLKDRENTLRMECMNYELEQGDLTFLGQPDHTAYVGYQPIQTLNR